MKRPISKSESSSELQSIEGWSARFHEIVLRDHRARRSLETLERLGVGFSEVSTMLALSCEFENNPAFNWIENARESMMRQTAEAFRLAKRLEEDCKMMEQFSSILPRSTIEKLAEVAEILRIEAKAGRELFSKHKLNTGFFLSWLITSIQEKTGAPRYREVSFLLESAYWAYGKEPPLIGEEALRKMHRRFMMTNPFGDLMSPKGKLLLFMVGMIVYMLQNARTLSPTTAQSNLMSAEETAALLAEIDSLPPDRGV